MPARATDGAMPAVLVVEDDEPIRRLIAAALRRRRLRVESVGNGRDAIERLRTKRYSLMTLDLMMPLLNGWDVLEWLRLNEASRPKSILVLSAAADQLFQKLDATLVNAVLIKPFDINVLSAYVAAAVVRDHDRRHRRIVRTPT